MELPSQAEIEHATRVLDFLDKFDPGLHETKDETFVALMKLRNKLTETRRESRKRKLRQTADKPAEKKKRPEWGLDRIRRIRLARVEASHVVPNATVASMAVEDDADYGEDKDDTTIEANQRSRALTTCYQCRSKTRAHQFYNRMCSACGDVNMAKRQQVADMTDRVCLVTGARVKIGAQTALKLLRCNATVIATTRFPRDLIRRFACEHDFDQWKERLHVFGLDMRDLASVERFVARVLNDYDRLDVLINNAAQTIRRPPVFYRTLLDTELSPLPAHLAPLLRDDSHVSAAMSQVALLPEDLVDRSGRLTDSRAAVVLARSTPFSLPAPHIEDERSSVVSHVSALSPASSATLSPPPPLTAAVDSSASSTCSSTFRLTPSALLVTPATDHAVSSVVHNMSEPNEESVEHALKHSDIQVCTQQELLAREIRTAGAAFPNNFVDEDMQQVDLRPRNSWTLLSNEVSSVEMREVMRINAEAPFLLATRLRPLLARTAQHNDGKASYCVMVSSMEGVFRRLGKQVTHVHTNMAKASLNMFVRTSGAEFAADNVFLTAVDTGWVTDEQPLLSRAKTNKHTHHQFAVPIDIVDGAARVLDPVFVGVNDNRHLHSVFLKNYQPSHW